MIIGDLLLLSHHHSYVATHKFNYIQNRTVILLSKRIHRILFLQHYCINIESNIFSSITKSNLLKKRRQLWSFKSIKYQSIKHQIISQIRPKNVPYNGNRWVAPSIVKNWHYLMRWQFYWEIETYVWLSMPKWPIGWKVWRFSYQYD